nr:putative recombination stimulator [Neurospora crassa]
MPHLSSVPSLGKIQQQQQSVPSLGKMEKLCSSSSSSSRVFLPWERGKNSAAAAGSFTLLSEDGSYRGCHSSRRAQRQPTHQQTRGRPRHRRTRLRTERRLRINQDEESEDEDSDCHEDQDSEFNEDEEYPELQATWEATFVERAFAAYCSWIGNRKPSIHEQLPTTQVLWETVLDIKLSFSPCLSDMIQAHHPPTLDELKSLPEFSYADEPAWTVYLLILEHPDPEHPPIVYVGTGTDMTRGTHKRFHDYDRNYRLSSLTTIAYKNRYHISNKKILISAQCPEPYLVLPGRALFLIVETAMSHALCAYEDKSILDTNLATHHWGLAEYEGLCSHHSWEEPIRFGDWFTKGLTKAELSAAYARSSAKRLTQRLAKRNDKKGDAILASKKRWQSIKEDPIEHTRYITIQKQWYNANKDKVAESRRQYNAANKDKVAESQRQYKAANKDKVAESRRQYNAANKDKIAEYHRQYRAANKDKVAESQRQYRAANKDKVAESQRRYKAANKDKFAEYQRQYKAANRDRINAKRRERRNAKKKSRSPFPPPPPSALMTS